ncbi:hypothetical protein BV25DRAFT_1922701 [Artomyces pyxidatus]|uniref:Uncharacterized protein n=1 Tax=Artomyces pyxidatus TaxID=48021 RepID=A0ACB8SE02_9AGAM|nr:hypothetical protein BV25DRAFT_1922701 [Artomyces pyxidatus]
MSRPRLLSLRLPDGAVRPRTTGSVRRRLDLSGSRVAAVVVSAAEGCPVSAPSASVPSLVECIRESFLMFCRQL